MNPQNYDFILNQNQQPKKQLRFGGSKQRLIIVIAGFLVLLLVLVLFINFILGSGKDTRQLLAPVSAVQADILGITDIGQKEARNVQLINTTATVSLVVTSQNSATNNLLGKDVKKLIAPYQSKNYKEELEKAVPSGSFDTTYQALLTDRLNLYRQELVTAYDKAPSQTLKKQLQSYYAQVGLLLGEPTTPN